MLYRFIEGKGKKMGIDGLFDFYETATTEQIDRWMMQAELFILYSKQEIEI